MLPDRLLECPILGCRGRGVGVGPISIPGYEIERELGVGGMARVYLAVQTSLERRVALKVMAPALAADPNFTKRFLREARTIAALTHPNIVALFEVGVSADQLHYFSMQYLPGGDFAQRMRRSVAPAELVRVLTGIGKALGFAHQQGVVHRDVTPGNIMFDAADTPQLTDFGIARALTGSTRITSTGVSIGTSNYMSPEQARGGEVDGRSDLYSLGALAFEALCGRPPYSGPDGFAVAYAHVFEPIPRLPPELKHWQAFIDKALAKEGKDRFQTAEEMIEALAQVPLQADATALATVAGQNVNRRATTDTIEAIARQIAPPSPARNHRWMVPALSLVLVIGVGAAAYGLLGGGQSNGTASDPVPRAQTPTAAVAADSDRADPAPALSAGLPDTPDPLTQLAATDSTPHGDALPVDSSDENLDPDAELPPPSAYGPPTVARQIQTFLDLGQALLRTQRLQLPVEANATLFFTRVLVLDPTNASASAGLASVVDAYLDLADQDLDADRLPEGRDRLDRARQVAATPGLDNAALAARINERWTARVNALREAARTALAAWQGTAAEASIRKALALEPQDAELQRWLREAQVIGRPGYVFRDGQNAPELVIVGPGKVTLSGARRGATQPVDITTAFAVARRETTVGEFRRFLEASKHRMGGAGCRKRDGGFMSGASRNRTWRAPDFDQGDDHPVVCVGFDDAQAYVTWLSSSTGQKYRLLSEAEWQYLASKVTHTPCKSGNRADQSYRSKEGGSGHVSCDDGFAATAPVGRFEASPPGIYDIDGNVREWVADCGNDSHEGRNQGQGARSTGRCDERIILGTAWHSDKDEALVVRRAEKRDWLSNGAGFRVARDLPEGKGR